MLNNMKQNTVSSALCLLMVTILSMEVYSLQVHPKDIIMGLDDASLQQLDSDVSLQSDEVQEHQRMSNEWMWNQYLASTPDDTSNHYHYDQQAHRIVLSQEEVDQQALKADQTFAKRKQILKGGNTELLQEKAQLQQAIDQMQGQAMSQIQTNLQQEQIEQDLSQTQQALETIDANITAKKKRTLHIIPHSHTDVGWLSTTEQSFSGFQDETSPNSQYIGGVKDILDSVYEQLAKNDTRTFTYAETKFFKTWYENQTAEVQEKVKSFVKDGRLDLVNGGWSSPDEAVTTYDALIDNFMIGQQWLYKTFEHHSKISWQIDALGVSSGYARLAKDVGFDMMYFSKVNLAERKEMRTNKTRTQVWRPHEENLGKRKDILSVTLDSQKNNTLGSYCWPQGFWVDQNYLQDVPMILKKNETNYKFDKLVKGLYEEVNAYLENERTEHVFRPFGCDMAYVDAEMNYIITDQLLAVWNELGYNDDIEIKYSTPTKYLAQMKEVNQEWTDETAHSGWPLRRDGTFPFGSAPDVYQNGYYSTRPQLKKDIRSVSQKLHSSQRLISQQVIKMNATQADAQEIIDFQQETLDNLGVLQHNGVMGTTPQNVASNFSAKAAETRKNIEKLNAKYLSKALNETFNITISPENMDTSMGYNYTELNYTSLYQMEDQIMFVVQNPTQQVREERVEIQVPYHNYTLWELTNGTLVEVKKFDKFLPRTWKNTNATLVKSFCQIPVNFYDSYEVAKVFLIKNIGYQKEVIKANNGTSTPWNLNLPEFKQAGPHDIHNYPSNYKKLKPASNITSGNKTLTFLEVRKNKGQTNGALEKSFFQEDQLLAFKVGKKQAKAENATANGTANGTASASGNSTDANSTTSKTSKKKKDDNNGAAIFQYYDNSTGISQKFAFNLRYYIGAYYDKSKELNKTANSTSGQFPNATNLQQDHRSDGMYEFSVNGTNATQKSLKYGNIAIKRSKFRQNANSSEILLVWEQSYSKVAKQFFNASANSSQSASQGGANSSGAGNATSSKVGDAKQQKQMLMQSINSTHPLDTKTSFKPPDKVRAAARITLSDQSDFLKFEVTINDLAVALDKSGKDIVVDWYMLDQFDSGKRFWADSNGLEMVPQQLFKHRDYNYTSNNTVSANFYPVTSAIAIRDQNNSKPVLTKNASESVNSTSNGTLSALAKLPGFSGKKQVTIMNDRSQGGSSGLRGGKNIEFMQHRRFKKMDNYGVEEPLNELDNEGKGIQVSATYWMEITDATGKTSNSSQRANQRAQDQPLLVYYSKNFQMPAEDKYTVKEQPSLASLQDIHSLLETQPSPGAEGQTPEFGAKEDAPNKQYKESKTLKTIPYAQGLNEISLRVVNLEDHFNKYAETIPFDVNAWAREFFLEANEQKTSYLQGLKIEITEMNLGGSIEKALLKHDNGGKFAQTKWKTDITKDPKNAPVKPVDFLQNYTLPQSLSVGGQPINETNFLVNLEPQRIRVFNIKYVHQGSNASTSESAPAPAASNSAPVQPPATAPAPSGAPQNATQANPSITQIKNTQTNKEIAPSSKSKSDGKDQNQNQKPIKKQEITHKPAAVVQTEPRPLSDGQISKLEENLKDSDFNQFTAHAMKTASLDKLQPHDLTTEDYQNIIDNTNIQVQH